MLGGAVHSGFQLALTRVGVAVGEAGSTPAAHAYVARNFVPEKRAAPLAVITMSIPLASAASLLGGGLLAEHGLANGFRGDGRDQRAAGSPGAVGGRQPPDPARPTAAGPRRRGELVGSAAQTQLPGHGGRDRAGLGGRLLADHLRPRIPDAHPRHVTGRGRYLLRAGHRAARHPRSADRRPHRRPAGVPRSALAAMDRGDPDRDPAAGIGAGIRGRAGWHACGCWR